MDTTFNTTTELKRELTQLAARHIAEEGLSYAQAKRKAAKQVGVAEHSAAMPTNAQLEQALRDYQAENQADSQPQELRRLRELACVWLDALQQLPTLEHSCHALAIGAAVNGTASEHSPLHLQVFTDEFKYFEMALLDAGIDVTPTQQKVDGVMRDVLVVDDQGVPVVMTLLPYDAYSVPKAPARGDYPQKASLAQILELLKDGTESCIET